MSKIENPKKVLKRTLFFGLCDQNALNSEKITQKSVTIKFFIFFAEKDLEIKYWYKLVTNDDKFIPKNPRPFLLRNL